MGLKVIIRPEAEAELSEAYHWYEERLKGLGDNFFLAIDSAISLIQNHPNKYPYVYEEKKIRRALIRRFPFGIHYIAREDAIVILAVFHARRDPEKWKHRN